MSTRASVISRLDSGRVCFPAYLCGYWQVSGLWSVRVRDSFFPFTLLSRAAVTWQLAFSIVNKQVMERGYPRWKPFCNLTSEVTSHPSAIFCSLEVGQLIQPTIEGRRLHKDWGIPEYRDHWGTLGAAYYRAVEAQEKPSDLPRITQ